MRKWKAFLVALLCLTMLAGCVAQPIPGFQPTKPTAAQVKITPLDVTARYIRTDGYHEEAEYPQVTVLDSKAALEAYYQANKDKYDLEARIQTGVGDDADLGFLNIYDGYDDAFFAKSYIIAILLEEPSGSIRHKVTAASQYEDGRVGVAVERIVPEAGTDDMAQWHILVETSREAAVKDASEVCVHLDGKLAWDGGYVEPLGPVAKYREPPEAILSTPHGEQALRSHGYHWFYPNPDGTETAIIADQHSRPSPKESLEPVYIDGECAEPVQAYVCPGGDPADGVGYLVKLHWEIAPTAVTYTCWSDTVWQNSEIMEESVETLDNSAFYAKQGGYVYEIAARWENTEGYRGSANYYVYILSGEVYCHQEPEEHCHEEPAEPQVVDDPITGYCGNTWTALYIGDKKYEFMYGHSVTLTDILANLAYDPMKVCRCKPEYTVDTEFGKGYGINLTQGYARCEKGQADLTREQIEAIEEIIEWAETTNCQYLGRVSS